MATYPLSRRLVAEAFGTALLVATVVGSGIMAASLTSDVALALLANTLATGAILFVLISILGPVSGAHFNPAVSLVFALRRELSAGRSGLHRRANRWRCCRNDARPCDVRPPAAAGLGHDAHRCRAVACGGDGHLSALSSSSWPASDFAPMPWHCWSASTSRPPTGSRRRRRLPIRPSQSPDR